MFSDYDPLYRQNSLSSADYKQYLDELQKLQDICDAFDQNHDEGKFWTLSNRASCLANELANCRADLTACQRELSIEKELNSQLDYSRIHIALVFSSFSVALFITISRLSSIHMIILGVLTSAFTPLVLLYFAYGIVQLLYNRHPEMYFMLEKKDKQTAALVLISPILLAIIYRIIEFFASKQLF